MKRLAWIAPLWGALLFGCLDFVLSFRSAGLDLDTGEVVQMIGYVLGRHMLVGFVGAVFFGVLVLLPQGTRRFNFRVLVATALFSWIFIVANRDLTSGAWISRQWFAPYLRWGILLGGPVGIWFACSMIGRILRRLGEQGQRVFMSRGLALIAAAAAMVLAYKNVNWLIGQYPGIHLQLALGAYLLATASAYLILRSMKRPLGARGVAVTVILVMLLFGASLFLHGREAFAAARAGAGSFGRGVTSFSDLLRPVYDHFSVHREITRADVSDALAELQRTGALDYSDVLDKLIPNRKNYNVLLVAMDTVRWDHTGLAGYTKHPTTPRLDAFAKNAYVFRNAYTPYPTSNYAYNCILTGMSAGASPIHGYRSKLDWKWPEDIDYPKLFSKNGLWSCGIFSFDKADVANRRFFGYMQNGFDAFCPDQVKPWKMRGDKITASVRKQISGRKKSRFFVFAHYMEAHAPYVKWPGFAFGDESIDRYDSGIAFVDDQFGKVLDFLDQQGLSDNTIVVVLSDHGEALGEHGNTTHNSSVYQEEIHVPLAIRIPGLPGGTVNELTSLIDVFPTLSRVLGIKDDVRRMGHNLLPYMLEPGKHPEQVVYAEQYTPRATIGYLEQRGVIHDGKKFIEVCTQPESEFQLFDLEQDPHERKNLFGKPDYAEAQAILAGFLDAKIKAVRGYHGNRREDFDPIYRLQKELEKLLADMDAPDPKVAAKAASLMRNRLRSRFDSLDAKASQLPPAFLERIRKKALEQALSAFANKSRVRWELYQILDVLPNEENARFFRLLMNHKHPRYKRDGAIALAHLGLEEARPVLHLAIENIPDKSARFTTAIALSNLGEHQYLSEFVPILRGRSTWEVAPLLRALAAAKSGEGLDILYGRLTVGGKTTSISDFTIKQLIINQARAAETPWADLVLSFLTDDADLGIKRAAHAALVLRHGEEQTAELLKRYAIEREALAAQANGEKELVVDRYRAYVREFPDAPARVFLGLAKGLVNTGERGRAADALKEMKARGDAQEQRVAQRMLDHIEDLKWFYQPADGEWKADIEVVDGPKWYNRNRSFFFDVKFTNRSDVYWMGGIWQFAPVLAVDIVNEEGELFVRDGRGRPVTRHRVYNFLPPEGLAPGETIRMTLVGHVPSGYWENGHVVFSFFQNGTSHIPSSGNWLLQLPPPVRPQ